MTKNKAGKQYASPACSDFRFIAMQISFRRASLFVRRPKVSLRM